MHTYQYDTIKIYQCQVMSKKVYNCELSVS